LKGSTTMKQYEFQIFNRRTGRPEFVRATAASAVIARSQIVLAYAPHYLVADLHSNINPPHKVLGEIDCSTLRLSDTEWMIREASKAEAAGVTA